ncbi:MAG: hypothetical protein AAFO89_14570 [Planctomycetota bacterium]
MVGLGKQVVAGHADDAPEPLRKSPALRAVSNALGDKASMEAEEALLRRSQEIDRVVRRTKAADFRGKRAKENEIKAALLPVCNRDPELVERLFTVLMLAMLTIDNTTLDVIYKDIKNVHLSVHPPTGRSRIAAPLESNRDVVRAFAISR